MKSCFFVSVAVVIAAFVNGKGLPAGAAFIGAARIINGEEAVKNEFSHQIMLMYQGQFACGGSIISQDWAITAAHCVDGRETALFTVRVNQHDVDQGDFDEYHVSRVIKHESYNTGSGAFPNNVALLRLTTAGADLSRNVISVAAGADNFEGDSCTISGWGRTETGALASVLMKSDGAAMSNAQCTGIWGSNIAAQHICFQGNGDNGSGACNGDSGGPMVCKGVLAGVASWGMQGCHNDMTVERPSVYARTSSFRNWIQTNCNCL